MKPYFFLNNIVLRCPAFSFQNYNIKNLEVLLQNKNFQQAIYLASTGLYEAIAVHKFKIEGLSEKLKQNLLKYYNRMSFRPTPFGTFSTISLAYWGEASVIDLKHGIETSLHFDQEVALLLAGYLTAQNNYFLKYQINPSLHQFYKEFRFIKCNATGDSHKIDFTLESFDFDLFVQSLMKYCGELRSVPEITSFISIKTGATSDETFNYLLGLISHQILLSEIQANIIGNDYMLELLYNPSLSKFELVGSFKKLYGEMRSKTSFTLNEIEQLHQNTKPLLDQITPKTPQNLFYANGRRKVNQGCVSLDYQQKIWDGLECLQKISITSMPEDMASFVKAFQTKFDRQSVPLMHALDPTVGVGYGGLTINPVESDLLRDVGFTKMERPHHKLNWTAIQQLLLNLWHQDPERKMTDPIIIRQEDLDSIPNAKESLQLPPTFPVMFRIINNKVFVEAAGGVTATAIIGRFTSIDDNIHQIGMQLAQHEIVTNRGVVFAEIGQQGQPHTDNINRRKPVYDYEIPINVRSLLPHEKQLLLSDLWVRYENGEILLESKKLGKRVIPRLSSAYNYNHSDLPIFRFLCDLQHQSIQSNLTLSLSFMFPGLNFYPRIEYKNTILTLATWYLKKEDFESLAIADVEKSKARFNAFRKKWQLPKVISLGKLDQQLVFDLDNVKEVGFFLYCIKSEQEIRVQEFLLPDTCSASQSKSKLFISQYIAFLYTNENVYQPMLHRTDTKLYTVKRAFVPGSKWLYLKIYCHPSVANQFLSDFLLPLLNTRVMRKLDCWFFVRYTDPGYHLRLRFKIQDQNVGPILEKFKKRIASHPQFNVIQEYQADTYLPELERYGADTMLLVEDFFNASSNLTIHFLKNYPDSGSPYPDYSFAMRSVLQLMVVFYPEVDKQLIFLNRMTNTFYAEFAEDKSLKVDMDKKYRLVKNEISLFMNDVNFFAQLKLETLQQKMLEQVSLILQARTKADAEKTAQLLADLIHMHINRMFAENQRRHELLLYYFLLKYQTGKKAALKPN